MTARGQERAGIGSTRHDFPAPEVSLRTQSATGHITHCRLHRRRVFAQAIRASKPSTCRLNWSTTARSRRRLCSAGRGFRRRGPGCISSSRSACSRAWATSSAGQADRLGPGGPGLPRPRKGPCVTCAAGPVAARRGERDTETCGRGPSGFFRLTRWK